MRLKNILLVGLAFVLMVGVAKAEIAGVGTSTLNSKPAGQTREQAMFKALAHTITLNGSFRAQSVTPNSGSETASVILPGVRCVDVGAVTNDANDFIVLPSLASVPVGHEIIILCNAGGNFEMRTPATSAEEINSEDCDGTKEYLMTDTQVVKVYKISDTIGWMAHPFTAIGAVATAVVPD